MEGARGSHLLVQHTNGVKGEVCGHVSCCDHRAWNASTGRDAAGAHLVEDLRALSMRDVRLCPFVVVSDAMPITTLDMPTNVCREAEVVLEAVQAR